MASFNRAPRNSRRRRVSGPGDGRAAALGTAPFRPLWGAFGEAMGNPVIPSFLTFKTWQNKVCFHVFAPFRDYRLVILDCNLWVPMVEPGPSGADTLAVPLSVAFVLCTWRWDFQAGNRLSCNQRKIEPNDYMLNCLNVQFSNGSFRHSSLSGDSFHPHF